MLLRDDMIEEQLKIVKLIATDIDGTLLNHAGEIDSRTMQVLTDLKAAGRCLVLATGRPFAAIPTWLLGSELFDYAITSNGTSIIRISDQVCVVRQLLSEQSVTAVLLISERYGYPLEVVVNGESHVPRWYYEDPLKLKLPAKVKPYVQQTRKPVADIRRFITTHAGEIESMNIIVDDPEKKEEILEMLWEMTGLYVTSSVPYYLELSPAGAHKGTALEALAKSLNISMAYTIAFGDSHNDMELLQAAGIAVAMGDACDELKAVAHIVTDTCDEEGLYKVLKYV